MTMPWHVVEETELPDVSSVPFPSNLGFSYARPSSIHPRNSFHSSHSTSSSLYSSYGPYHLRSPAQSIGKMSRQLSLSPVVEEGDCDFQQLLWTPAAANGRPIQRPPRSVGRAESGLLAEEITMAMMTIPPTRHGIHTKPKSRKAQTFRCAARQKFTRAFCIIRGIFSSPHRHKRK